MSKQLQRSGKTDSEAVEIGLRGAVVRDPSQREAQRQRALIAAASVFARQGYEAATMNDIAKEFGVSKGVLYYQFRSKQELIMETRRAASGRAADRLEEIVKRPLPALERMRQALNDLIAMNFDELARHVILTSLRFGLDQEYVDQIRAVERRYEQLLIALLEEGMAEGAFVKADSKLTAFTLIGAAMAPATWYHPDGQLSEAEIIDGLTTQLLRSITPSVVVD
ncbi:TetR/AcrR family transcriptional regulator [Microbulbifer donghaiensis]|uniref:TetR/AcrR family transcriptional regulator n=1 Tax=Microbulbifer donghaiensis TaxID=494016 RepID=UPI0013565F34|nr:TetR/AcrR family transcriptional regulator [Microbulbifer donghaiensis]